MILEVPLEWLLFGIGIGASIVGISWYVWGLRNQIKLNKPLKK